jgi:hypothetical protein
MVSENNIIEMMDGKKYAVLDKMAYNGDNYLYIAMVNDDTTPTGDFNIVKETVIEEVPIMESIEDDDLYENLKLAFLKRNE